MLALSLAGMVSVLCPRGKRGNGSRSERVTSRFLPFTSSLELRLFLKF